MVIKFIKDFIKRLGEENSKTFGDKRLDCCDLNRTNNTDKKTNNNNK